MTELSKFTIDTPKDQEIHEFFKCLDDKSITDATRKNIVETFGKYKDLLMSTLNELQRQRLNRNIPSSHLDHLILFMSPDSNSVEEALDELLRDADDVEKKLRFRDWARDNMNDFKNQLERVSNTLKDENDEKSMEDLKKKWCEMKKELETLLEEIKHDSDKAKKMRKILGHAILVVTFVSICTVPFSAGAVAVAGVGVAEMAASAAAAAAVIGAVASPLDTFLVKIIGGNTKKVQDELIRMALLTSTIETQLSRIRLSLGENNGAVICSENASHYAAQLKSLVEDLRTCKRKLDELVDNIKEMEVAVSSELDSFNERIYEPLLRRLYGRE